MFLDAVEEMTPSRDGFAGDYSDLGGGG